MQHKLPTLVAAIGIVVASLSTEAAPQQPGVVVAVEGTKVSAFWNPVIGATEYTLFYAPYPQLTPINSVSMARNTSLTVDLPVGASYAVAVKSKDSQGESDYSNIEFFTVNEPNSEDANASVSTIISSIASNVILTTYEDFTLQAKNLTNALLEFQFTPTDENLRKVQFAWRDTRKPWEQTETFLFGPVDTQGLDPALDSWPVNRTDLDAVLNTTNTLDVPFVKGLNDTLHGFHTIEYLIFGEANNKTAANMTTREIEYLVSVTSLLHTHVDTLANAWRTTGGNFITQFETAGQGSKTYPSETAALQELLNGMIGIIDEVANGKIADPFSQTNTELVESQFSFNSLLDFENNIRGAENVYLGRYLQKDGAGLNDLVKRNDSALDTQIRQNFDEAISAIKAIPFPFRNAISNENGRALIVTAQEKISALQTTLESKLLPKITSYQ